MVFNHPQLEKGNNTEKSLNLNDTDSTKALGMRWMPHTDTFRFPLDESFTKLTPTKRTIISVSARFFDPLGLLCPIGLTSKILLQSLWQLQLEWDESIPMSLHTSWESLKKNLLNLHAVTIPRYTFASGCSAVQVYGFADASSQAYGCCIYIRAIENGQAHCRLLAAKSRVAPLKPKTIQRLEL